MFVGKNAFLALLAVDIGEAEIVLPVCVGLGAAE